jgi:hypothetical protein
MPWSIRASGGAVTHEYLSRFREGFTALDVVYD